jgi:hypothetical protein
MDEPKDDRNAVFSLLVALCLTFDLVAPAFPDCYRSVAFTRAPHGWMDVAGTGPVSIAMLGSSIVSVQGKCYEHCLGLLSLMFDPPFLEVLSF